MGLLLVYTMGKVASTTISESITSARIECHDIHTLRESSLFFQMKKSVETGVLPHNHIGRSINIYHRFQRASKVKIITCLRDSFSRNVSAIFQNLPQKEYTLNDVRNIIENSAPDAPGSWLRNEFAATIGINLLREKFNINDKYAVLKKDRFEILSMRIDLSNDKKQELISDFVGEEIVLQNKNEAQNKWYDDLYREFRAKGELSEEWVTRCVKSKYMEKFYSEVERQQFEEKAFALVRK